MRRRIKGLALRSESAHQCEAAPPHHGRVGVGVQAQRGFLGGRDLADAQLQREHLLVGVRRIVILGLAAMAVMLAAGCSGSGEGSVTVAGDVPRPGGQVQLSLSTRPLAQLELEPRLGHGWLRADGRALYAESAHQLLARWRDAKRFVALIDDVDDEAADDEKAGADATGAGLSAEQRLVDAQRSDQVVSGSAARRVRRPQRILESHRCIRQLGVDVGRHHREAGPQGRARQRALRTRDGQFRARAPTQTSWDFSATSIGRAGAADGPADPASCATPAACATPPSLTAGSRLASVLRQECLYLSEFLVRSLDVAEHVAGLSCQDQRAVAVAPLARGCVP